MKAALLAPLLLLLAGADPMFAGDPTRDLPGVPAREAPREPAGYVLQVGIYERFGPIAKREAPETSTGWSSLALGPVNLIQQTNRVPAVLGTYFGIRYYLANLPETHGRRLEVTRTLQHPPMHVPGRGVSTGFSTTARLRVRGGYALGGAAYCFDYPYEVLPGVWIFEVSLQGRLLVRQIFFVYPPPPGAGKF